MMETITLTGREQQRLVVVTQIMMGELSMKDGAAAVGISKRQMQRIVAAYREEGPAGLIHGNRRRQPVHRLPSTTREKVAALLGERYAGVNDTHAQELLAEQEGIVLSRSSVRRIRRAAGIATVRPRHAPRHRRRRERRSQAGMLIQIDGSKHRWLGTERPVLTLLAGIDDATGLVVAACFREQEDTAGYLQLLYQLVEQMGRPEALYHDRHSIFVRDAHEPDTLAEQLAGRRNPTQLGRAMQQFGIASVIARSPQAKGRIERLFQTLQDRLVTELRLAGVQTLQEANQLLPAFLGRFNTQFVVPATDPQPAWRPLEPAMDPWQICSFGYVRTVAHDDTLRLGEHHLQLGPRHNRLTWAKAIVEVREHLDGSLSVWHGDQEIAVTPAPPDARQLRARGGLRSPVAHPASSPIDIEDPHQTPMADDAFPSARRKPRKAWKPAADHPWRRSGMKG